jgi:fucose 4-O-acetylase-like acetyltransferase
VTTLDLLARVEVCMNVAVIAVTIWVMLAGVADVITTERALARGARELNPLMRALQEHTGRFWWIGKLMIHALVVLVVLLFDGWLGIAVGATFAAIITAVAIHNERGAR